LNDHRALLRNARRPFALQMVDDNIADAVIGGAKHVDVLFQA